MSSFDINNHHDHHHKTTSITITANYYYCYCCCCCWGCDLLLGLLVLRPCISSLLQSATSVLTKCDSLFYYKGRWSVISKCDSFFLESATSVFTKSDRYYEVRQFYFNVQQVLQSATEQPIIGDPGAASQDDRMFVVKDYSKIETSS